MSMGKMTALAYNVQVTNHLAECVRVGVVMDDDDTLSHYLTTLDTTRVQEVLTEVNTKRTNHVEHHGVMSNVIAQMDARFGGGANPPAGQVPVAPQIKVTLQQVIALCQEVEDRNNSKNVPTVTVTNTVIEKCNYCNKPNHKERDCCRKTRDGKNKSVSAPQSSRSVTQRISAKGS